MKSHASVTAEGHESRSSPVTNLQISTSPAAFFLNLAGTKHTIVADVARLDVEEWVLLAVLIFFCHGGFCDFPPSLLHVKFVMTTN